LEHIANGSLEGRTVDKPDQGIETFEPSGARGALLDSRIHFELGASLGHLADALVPISEDMSASLLEVAHQLENNARVPPIVFRRYYQLVEALLEQDQKSAEALLDSIKNSKPRPQRLSITHYGHPHADQVCLDLTQEGLRIAPISEESAAGFEEQLRLALSLMEEALPQLHAEITAIVHEIILVQEPPGDKFEFHGASHYQFWGLLLLNPKHHRAPLEIIEVLAHEASHSLLFGLTIAEPLVRNPDTDLFTSPLRLDKRPMDGIYHATYVSARMCWAMEAIASSDKLSADERLQALNLAKIDRENYEAGLDVILKHADLTDSGTRILSRAREWMAG